MIVVPTFEYLYDVDLEDLQLWVTINKGADLLDLSSGYTFQLDVYDRTGTQVFETTTLFTGAAGSGVPGNGTPNLTKQWATTGELHSLDADETYTARLTITRDSDGRWRKRKFYLRINSDTL